MSVQDYITCKQHPMKIAACNRAFNNKLVMHKVATGIKDPLRVKGKALDMSELLRGIGKPVKELLDLGLSHDAIVEVLAQ